MAAVNEAGIRIFIISDAAVHNHIHVINPPATTEQVPFDFTYAMGITTITHADMSIHVEYFQHSLAVFDTSIRLLQFANMIEQARLTTYFFQMTPGIQINILADRVAFKNAQGIFIMGGFQGFEYIHLCNSTLMGNISSIPINNTCIHNPPCQ